MYGHDTFHMDPEWLAEACAEAVSLGDDSEARQLFDLLIDMVEDYDPSEAYQLIVDAYDGDPWDVAYAINED